MVKHYNHTVMFSVHGSSVSQRQNYLDLDPTYRDAWGQPVLRMTFDFPQNDLRMAEYVTAKAVEIGKAMGAKQVAGSARKGPYTTQQYQTTHNTGGAVMGSDPSTSVVNRYLQSWDVANVFVIGASAYPQNASWNPTGTLGALTYWAIDALKNKYLKKPGTSGVGMSGPHCRSRVRAFGLLWLCAAAALAAASDGGRQDPAIDRQRRALRSVPWRTRRGGSARRHSAARRTVGGLPGKATGRL